MMNLATGCISIGTTGAPVQIDRVIEYFQPHNGSCMVWVDVFLDNTSNEDKNLLLLHRGSLSAANVTRESWASPENVPATASLHLTNRIVRLHHSFDPIRAMPEGIVAVGERDYQVWEGPELVSVVIGDKAEADVPFTLWRIGPFSGGQRHVFRIRMVMTPQTFERHVGPLGTFYAYGEAILLDKIEYEDLTCYEGSDAEEYRQVFAEFNACSQMLPDKFEYLVVSPEGTTLEWETTPLSPLISPQLILEDDLRSNTRWLVASYADKWSLIGKRYNGFVVKITTASA